jgi:hypothetical protein
MVMKPFLRRQAAVNHRIAAGNGASAGAASNLVNFSWTQPSHKFQINIVTVP